VTALETNLGLEVKVFSTTEDQSKIEDSVTDSMYIYDFCKISYFPCKFHSFCSLYHVRDICISDSDDRRKIGPEKL